MAKLQQYFAQRDEKDLQQTEKESPEVDVLVPAIDEAPLNLSTPQTNVASLLAEPRKTEGQKPIAGSVDDRNQVPATQTHTEEKDSIPVIYPELITSKSQTRQPPLDFVKSHKSLVESQLLESRHDKETIPCQTVSLKCQTSDKSIGKTVEKAWESFEKCAIERMGSTADTYSSVGKTNQVDNTLSENVQGSQSFGHHYTFETIVAPLYHQVFERMENEEGLRRRVKNSVPKADESIGKMDDGSLRIVTYPNVETRSNPEISAKPMNDDDYHGACKETVPEYLHNTKSASENALSVLNVKRKHVAEIAFQDTVFPDITDSLLDANISESNTSQVVIPVEKQHASNSLLSVSWEESIIEQTEQTPQLIILQSECLNDTENSLESEHLYSGYSVNTLQQDLICIDSAILPAQSEEDTTAAQPSPTMVSENPQSEERSVGQTCFESQVNHEINKMPEKEAQASERTLNTGIKCLEESYTPMPDSTLFHSDITSNVTHKSEASSPSQDRTQVTIQPQIPATVFFSPNQEVTGATVPQLQTTDDTNLIHRTTNTCQNSDRSHRVGSETESNSGNKNVGVDRWEKMENDTETIQTEILPIRKEETAVDRILQNFIHVSQISETEEHRISDLNFPDEVPDGDELLVEDMAMSNISSNPENPEDASQQEEEIEKEEEDVKENVQLKNPGKNEEQVLTDMTENQSEEVKEIKEVEERLEEQEHQQQEEKREYQEEQDEEVELGNENKFNDGSYYTEDYEEEVKKVDKEKDAEPRRNGVEWEHEKDLEEETEEQEIVCGVTNVVMLQNIANIDTFIGDVHLHVEQHQQSTSLEPMSQEPGSERDFIGEEKEIFCGTDSTQQALTPNSDVVFSVRCEAVEKNSEFIDQEEDVCRRTDIEHVAEDAIGEVDTLLEKQMRDCLNEQSENVDDSASTESLTDDEMEVYLLRLRNTQKSELKDGISMVKRHSVSRTWTTPSPMPSISEYMDEDQPNALLDDLTNEQMIELEKATLPLLNEEEEVTETNLLWWKEFFSSDNMPKMIVYTLLFVVFLITTYICDFIACFGLYLLALYWLYFQVQREPVKAT